MDHIVGSRRGEAILAHNHPHFWLRRIAAELGLWRPTASETDRDVALSYHQKVLSMWLKQGDAGRLRWYLVDEGNIREFRLPSWSRLQKMVQWLDSLATEPSA